VDNKMSAGPHKLIREGAVLTASLEDILDNLGPLPEGVDQPMQFEPTTAPGEKSSSAESAEPAHALLPNLSEHQSSILAQLDGDALSADAIIERTSLPAEVVMRELTMLTLKGAVRRVDGQTFARKR
jgi:DNA processing protein